MKEIFCEKLSVDLEDKFSRGLSPLQKVKYWKILGSCHVLFPFLYLLSSQSHQQPQLQ